MERSEFHKNAEFLSGLSSNAYEFDKSEMPVHLRKSVVTFAKKLWSLTEHSSHKNFGSSKCLFQENEIV